MKKPMPKFFGGDVVLLKGNDSGVVYAITDCKHTHKGWIYAGVAINYHYLNFTNIGENELEYATPDDVERFTHRNIKEMFATTGCWFGDPSFGLDGQRPKLLCDNPSYVNPLVDYIGDDLKSCWLTWIRDR